MWEVLIALTIALDVRDGVCEPAPGGDDPATIALACPTSTAVSRSDLRAVEGRSLSPTGHSASSRRARTNRSLDHARTASRISRSTHCDCADAFDHRTTMQPA